MYDLLITGARVVDPANRRDGAFDIAVSGGAIAAVESPGVLAPSDAVRLVDAHGLLLTPGVIDAHVHVFHGVNANGVDPDLAGVGAGVTTVVDGGSAGAATFRAFPKYVMPAAQTEIIPFLHYGKFGLSAHPDIYAPDSVSIEDTLRVMHEYADLIVGLKVRMVSPALDVFGIEMLRSARRIADETGTRLMVHIGDNARRTDPAIISEALPLLAAGDILTHLFTPNPGGIIGADGRTVPELADAVARGVVLDTAHGDVNFSLDVARSALAQGVVPDCISTDLNTNGWRGVAPGMPDIMTRFLALGFSLDEVITMSTVNPAKAVGIADRAGSIAIGKPADLSLFELRSGSWRLRDSFGATLDAQVAFIPKAAIKSGVLHAAVWGPRPWGWEPERAES